MRPKNQENHVLFPLVLQCIHGQKQTQLGWTDSSRNFAARLQKAKAEMLDRAPTAFAIGVARGSAFAHARAVNPVPHTKI